MTGERKRIRRGRLLAGALAIGMLGAVTDAGAASMQDIKAIQLEIEKLRAMLESAKELKALEKAGLSHSDTSRMRKALEAKIQRMIDKLVVEIQGL